jgi:hypothetical protein
LLRCYEWNYYCCLFNWSFKMYFRWIVMYWKINLWILYYQDIMQFWLNKWCLCFYCFNIKCWYWNMCPNDKLWVSQKRLVCLYIKQILVFLDFRNKRKYHNTKFMYWSHMCYFLCLLWSMFKLLWLELGSLIILYTTQWILWDEIAHWFTWINMF